MVGVEGGGIFAPRDGTLLPVVATTSSRCGGKWETGTGAEWICPEIGSSRHFSQRPRTEGLISAKLSSMSCPCCKFDQNENRTHIKCKVVLEGRAQS